jgi:hypothetical protein
LFDAVLRLLKIEQCTEALRFIQRVNVLTLEVFDQLRLQCFRIREVLDANRNGIGFRQLGSPEPPRSCDDLETAFGAWPHQ